ncbi:MAG: PilZ domain-containing protein [Syntrophaceae bacterium]|nr:PilZ domain-containing protein [Syntrophaceae bacterium]
MNEKRRANRLKEASEITITILAGGEKFSKKKVVYDSSKDISASGARIHSNIFLPIDILLRIDFKLKNLQQMITAMGKVKWIKIICEDESYEAGVEFVNTPKEAIQKIAEYISWKQYPPISKSYKN